MASAPLQPGSTLNERYLIMDILGQGGMGTVYKAEHVRLNSIVAVKEIRGQATDEAQNRMDLDKCEHEARFLVRLNHPHLPKVTDAFIENENFYLVMEYIEGVTLESRLSGVEGGALDVDQVVEWGLQIADVLAYLHVQDPPIIFRDLKPSNVMVQPDNNIKLIDFGIARRFQPGASKDTALLGSVGYSPPEQFGKGQTDQRSDVYSFGATLHHLLTGRDPAQQPFKFPPARTFNPAVPNSLSHVLEICLAMDPEARPQSINVVAVQLLGVREELLAQRVHQAALKTVLPPGVPGIEAVPKPRVNPNRLPTSGEGQRVVVREARSSSSNIRMANGRGTDPSTGRNVALVVLPILALIILGGTAVAFMSGHRSGSKSNGKLPVVNAPLLVENTNKGVSGNDPTGTEPGPVKTTSPDAPANPGKVGDQTPPVQPIQPAQSPNILSTAVEPVEGDMLPIAVSGTITGHANLPVQLVIYFFDNNNNPIAAIDKSELAYRNDAGLLCVYKTIDVKLDEYGMAEVLKVPVRLLAGSQQPTPFRYVAMLLLDGQKLSESASTVLLPSTYGGPTTPSGNSGGAASPANHTPVIRVGGHIGG